jgi:hypothetical protein
MRSHSILSLNRRDMMAAIILGVAAGAIATFAERFDAILTGGNYTPLGYINTYTWLIVSATLFGPIGSIMTTEIQALLGLITFANPLSWLWPFINFLFALGVGLVSIVISKIRQRCSTSIKIILMSLTCAILDIPLVYVVIVTVLGLPFGVYLGSLPIYVALQLIPSTFLSYVIVRAILRSEILAKRNE